jgi:hypothetical protein
LCTAEVITDFDGSDGIIGVFPHRALGERLAAS